MKRFQESGLITVRPGDVSPVYIGDFSIEEGHDTIWVNVTSRSEGECPWPWSYGLLTWVTERGRELGTVKINGVCEGEVFKLGVGLSPSFRTGRMEFTPRNYNLKWIELGHPWTLTFEFFSGTSGGGSQQVGGSTLFVPYVEDIPPVEEPELPNTQPDFFIEDGLAFLLFNWFLK